MKICLKSEQHLTKPQTKAADVVYEKNGHILLN